MRLSVLDLCEAEIRRIAILGEGEFSRSLLGRHVNRIGIQGVDDRLRRNFGFGRRRLDICWGIGLGERHCWQQR